MDVLTDLGFLLRTTHVGAGVLWLGLAWFFELAWRPAVGHPGPDAQRGPDGLLRRALWWYRWGALVSWTTGMVYGGFLGGQHPDGLVRWMHEPWRGRWISLGFVYATLMVFLVWFVIVPRQNQLMAGGLDEATTRAFRRTIAWSTRVVAWLGLPLLYVMGAGRHAGEIAALSESLPTHFGWATLAATLPGLAVGALLSGLASLVGRR